MEESERLGGSERVLKIVDEEGFHRFENVDE
jgi:hypothetical protein